VDHVDLMKEVEVKVFSQIPKPIITIQRVKQVILLMVNSWVEWVTEPIMRVISVIFQFPWVIIKANSSMVIMVVAIIEALHINSCFTLSLAYNLIDLNYLD